MAARHNAGGGTSSARRRRERRLHSFQCHERMAIALDLSETQHHGAPRQKKERTEASTEFFAMSSETSVMNELQEADVFPSFLGASPYLGSRGRSWKSTWISLMSWNR